MSLSIADIYRRKKCMLDLEMLEPTLYLIDQKNKGKEERDKVKNCILEILNAPKGLVNIDYYDIRDFFQEGGEIHACDVSVDAGKENRMDLLMEQILLNTKWSDSYKHVLVYFFFPKEYPLLMEELQPFHEWTASNPNKITITWGMTFHPSQTLRVIMLFQQ